MRQVTHALLTRPPLSHSSFRGNQSASFDLHVLSTPPAFILSQDQTLVKSVCIQFKIAWQFCSCLLFCQVCFKLLMRLGTMFLAHLASPMLAPTSVGKQVFHVRASLAQFSACSEKLFKRIFQGCCLLFNYQGSSLLPSQRQLIYIITSSICLSTTFFIFSEFLFSNLTSRTSVVMTDLFYCISDSLDILQHKST